MGFTLDQVVPWGRNLEEYRRMFSLTDDDLALKVLGCADGPASVNAELYEQGRAYVSLDPIYQFSARQIRERVVTTTPIIAKQLEENRADYQWEHYASPRHLVQARRAAMDTFLRDFKQHRTSQRYVTGSLPTLPFADQCFDLVLCSHCLFTYSAQLDKAFHQQAMLEMCRVGREVRVFPLLALNGEPSCHLPDVLDFLEEHNILTELVTVDYEFQKGGNQLLIMKTP